MRIPVYNVTGHWSEDSTFTHPPHSRQHLNITRIELWCKEKTWMEVNYGRNIYSLNDLWNGQWKIGAQTPLKTPHKDVSVTSGPFWNAFMLSRVKLRLLNKTQRSWPQLLRTWAPHLRLYLCGRSINLLPYFIMNAFGHKQHN